MNWKNFFDCFNFKKQCLKYNTKIWQCPQFLFLVMGLIIVISIIITNFVAQKYAEPLIVSLIILGVTAILFVISFIVISSFDRVAQASLAKSEFIRIMSHQLRTPLSAIKWQVELLLNEKVKPNTESIKEILAEINDKNQKMIWTVNNFLDVSFVEDNNLVLIPSAFSLGQVVQDVVKSLEESAKKANLQFFVTIPQDFPVVYADLNKIKNIVYHMVDNSIRYSDKKGYVSVILEATPFQVKCSVTDEGVGISDNDAKKIFKKFFRAEGALEGQTSGTGIGLFLAKIVIEKSGGKIGFKSAQGKGTTFWFILPLPQLSARAVNY